jgi:pimeloyl-ACP methyl ester carboxylesterase
MGYRGVSGSRLAACAAMGTVLAAASIALAVLAPSGALAAAAHRAADSVPGILGLPTGAPGAASAAEPVLPEPSSSEWPFPSSFSRTSGTGLLSGGASLWTDFLFDDHGPLGSPVGIADNLKVSSLAEVHGGFEYPEGEADKDGADIFTAAVGYTREATYWRVDWNTLANADVPIAEWTFATGSATPAGGEEWPANAKVRSAGIQYALVVSAQHAQLLDVATGKPVAGAELHTEVNMQARSFIVRVPTSVLAVKGSWQVHLAAGLANAEGTEFATVPPQDGGLGGANVYNVTFRGYQQESELVCPTQALADSSIAPALEGELGGEGGEKEHVPVVECGNFWMENDQANTLASGDVSKYALTVNWAQLAAKRKTAEPEPTGYSNRWYVTPLTLGEGVVDAKEPNTYTGPTYLGRVQPYAVYVPTTYTKTKPTPLTWILHSLGANLNQYGGLAPTQLEEECQDRESICATTEGFSDGQWYYGPAEVDFWDVWHQLASSYDLNPDETVMSGYSMGGFASYKLALEYPDLFAQAMPLEGPVVCGERVIGEINTAAGGEQCESDGNTTPLIVNAKWIPYVMTYGAADELVPFTGGLEQVEAFNKLGYRYYAVLYPAEDHLVFATQNDFAPATSQLGHLERVQDPGSFTFTWYPDLDSSTLEIGPSRDYWLSGLQARDSAPGALATVSADSAAIREPEEAVEHHTGTTDGPTPAVTDSLTWNAGATPSARQTLQLSLTNVAAATLESVRAKLKCATITATTDGATALTLQELRPGSAISENGAPLGSVPASGTTTIDLSAGTTTLGVCSAST